MPVYAEINKATPTITMHWNITPDAQSFTIFRRDLNTSNWGNSIATLTTTDSLYKDINVSEGLVYEYLIQKQTNELDPYSGSGANIIGYGYVSASIKKPAVHERGIVWVNNPTDDSVMLRIEHHWAPADASYGRPAGAVLSKERYWNVDGIWGDDVNITSELIYSGLQSNSLIFGYLDKELIRITEDSLVLLYRPNASSAWAEATDYIKNSGSLFDKRGIIEVSNLKKGQYTLAMYDASLLNEKLITVPKYEFKVFPNPAQDELNLEFAKKHDCCMVEVTNTQGQVVLSEKLKGRSSTKKLDISKLAPGSYFVGVVTDNLAYDVKRFVVE